MHTTAGGSELLREQKGVAPIGLIVLEGAKELGEKINKHLLRWSPEDRETFIVESECPRFATGDSKGIIKETVRGKDLYFIIDVGNHSCKYKFFDKENHKSADDHYQDLKRLIQAVGGKAHRLNVIMPTLYGGRQHKRNYRESLDCAWMLQELRTMGVENIICFDAHDARVQNAVPLMGFDNVIPYYQVLKKFFYSYPDLNINKESFMIVSPDEGAMDRNKFYASVLGLDMGLFYKRRDYANIVNGRNPIIAHEYMGADVKGKDIFIADDVISSGDSMLDLAHELRSRGAKRVFIYATYPSFTHGLEKFDQAYENGLISGIIGTNLTYNTPELLKREWYKSADISKYSAYFVAAINAEISVSKIINPMDKISALLNHVRQSSL